MICILESRVKFTSLGRLTTRRAVFPEASSSTRQILTDRTFSSKKLVCNACRTCKSRLSFLFGVVSIAGEIPDQAILMPVSAMHTIVGINTCNKLLVVRGVLSSKSTGSLIMQAEIGCSPFHTQYGRGGCNFPVCHRQLDLGGRCLRRSHRIPRLIVHTCPYAPAEQYQRTARTVIPPSRLRSLRYDIVLCTTGATILLLHP